jgi:DNA-binding SARP family transcriptional activator/TolB-like protein
MIRFLAFGPPELHGSNPAELRGVLTQPRLLALLSYLAIDRPSGFRRRDSLVTLLWPELGHQSARNALRQVVHRLRRALGENVIASRGAEELAITDGQLWCDVAAFEDALDAGNISDAVALYRGDLLPGFFTSDAPEFERWLDEERARLRRRAATAAWLLVDRETGDGRPDAALHWARWAAALAPDDEAASRRLIELQIRLGDRAGALRSHEDLSRRLAEDFEATPSPETQALIQSVHDANVAVRPAGPSLPAMSDAHLFVGAPALPRAAVARPRRWVPAAVAAAALVATTAITLFGGDNRAAADSPRTVAVFPFAIRGSSDFAYLRDGMVDLISGKLEGAAGFHAVDPRSILAAMARSTDTVDVAASATMARDLGANWLIRGEILEIAGRLHLSATLYDIAREPRTLVKANVAAEGTAIFLIVDDLVGRLLATLTPGRDTALTSLAARTTHSLPALKAFLQGEQALRSGYEAEAAAAFRDATDIDSTFALAQYRLAVVATWTSLTSGPSPTQRAAIAERHAARMTPLGRDLVRAYRAYRDMKIDTAEAIYREVTRGHPDNVEAWLMLGEKLFHYNPIIGRSPFESREAFQRVLVLDPSDPHALLHLARLAALEGNSGALDSLTRDYGARHANADRMLEIRALKAYLNNDSSERLAVASIAGGTDDFTKQALLQAGLLYAQNIDAVQELTAKFSSTAQHLQARRYGNRLLAEIPFARGAWSEAKAASQSLVPDDKDWAIETEALLSSEQLFGVSRSRLLALRDSLAARPSYPLMRPPALASDPLGGFMRDYLLGLLDARLGDLVSARRHHDALVRTTGEDAEVARALAHGLQASVLRTAGDLKGALAELNSFPYAMSAGLNRVGHWAHFERFQRAEILASLGREREALPWYGSAFLAYLPWIPAAHLRQGEIHERLGNHEAARFHFGRASAMWREAEPELRPLLTRALGGRERTSGETARK